jgi:glutaredoxin
VHYGDKPPAQAQSREVINRISSYAGPAQVTRAPQQASARKASARVVMYTTPTCGFCRQAKAHFNYRRVAFEERDVERSPEFRREFDRLGGRGVPVILVGEQRMDGYERAALDGMLSAEGL